MVEATENASINNMIEAEETQCCKFTIKKKCKAPFGFRHIILISCESFLYQLGYVVDNNQVGPGISEAEVSFIVNSTELTNSARKKTHNTGTIHSFLFLLANNTSLRLG